MKENNLPYLCCLRCDHKWFPRTSDIPKVCPHCHSKFWNKKYTKGEFINKKISKKVYERIGELTELSYDLPEKG